MSLKRVATVAKQGVTKCPFLKKMTNVQTEMLPWFAQNFCNHCPFLTEYKKNEEEGNKRESSQRDSMPDIFSDFGCPFAPVKGSQEISAEEFLQRSQASVLREPISGMTASFTQSNEKEESSESEEFSESEESDESDESVVETKARMTDDCGVPFEANASRESVENALDFKLNKLKEDGNYREFFDIERQCGSFPKAKKYDKMDGVDVSDDVTVWCNNDYLNMGQNKNVTESMINAIVKSGSGAGGTRNISGTTHYASELESSLSDLHDKESGLIFSSGYVANEACLSTLPKLLSSDGNECHIISDELNHASMINGIRNSRVNKHVFKHNDLNDLENILKKLPLSSNKIIAFESVYSMDGDIAPIDDICNLANKYNCITYLDEVHAVGMYGYKGGGVAQRDNIQDKVTIISGTLGKAFGVFGGYIVGPKNIIDSVRSFAPGFIFTTALPPSICAGAIASIDYLKGDNGQLLRNQQQEQVFKLKWSLFKAGLPVIWSNSHIIPLMIGNASKCKEASDLLLSRYKIYVQPINYPTVPIGTERFRLTPSPLHDDHLIEELVEKLCIVWDELDLQRKIPEKYNDPNNGEFVHRIDPYLPCRN